MPVRVRGIIPARAGFTPCQPYSVAGSEDHPRSRGVYLKDTLESTGKAGSSPLARGLRRGMTDAPGAYGIIPARAGFTGRRGCSWVRLPDHPRSRGVYEEDYGSADDPKGSSPLARGLLLIKVIDNLIDWIIPARAGFTSFDTHFISLISDHPRSRGVYSMCHDLRPGEIGSSPLARGLPTVTGWRYPFRGIIPARAGFTSLFGESTTNSTDHPRSRGVYASWRSGECSRRGSSPLARGLRHTPDHGRRPGRIIPARAGFTTPLRLSETVNSDHPRSRGVYVWLVADIEQGNGSSPLARGLRTPSVSPHWTGPDHPRSRGVYSSRFLGVTMFTGSSPLARGLRGRHPGWCGHGGIIPARAGFTAAPSTRPRPPRDHPRSRGVYASALPVDSNVSGSSPLARGLLPAPLRENVVAGIIPARAGFTERSRRCPESSRDHPRSRGVYHTSSWTVISVVGSSPLARGLLAVPAGDDGRTGIIPARAGFTPRRPPRRR